MVICAKCRTPIISAPVYIGDLCLECWRDKVSNKIEWDKSVDYSRNLDSNQELPSFKMIPGK